LFSTYINIHIKSTASYSDDILLTNSATNNLDKFNLPVIT